MPNCIPCTTHGRRRYHTGHVWALLKKTLSTFSRLFIYIYIYKMHVGGEYDYLRLYRKTARLQVVFLRAAHATGRRHCSPTNIPRIGTWY